MPALLIFFHSVCDFKVVCENCAYAKAVSGILPYLPGENVMKYAMRTRAVVDETTWSLFNQVKARVVGRLYYDDYHAA